MQYKNKAINSKIIIYVITISTVQIYNIYKNIDDIIKFISYLCIIFYKNESFKTFLIRLKKKKNVFSEIKKVY